MNNEFINIVSHLEKSGFLKKEAWPFKSKLDRQAEDEKKRQEGMGVTEPRRIASNGATEYYDPKAPKGQEWSFATPSHRSQFRKNEKENLEYKRRERVDDTVAGFFMDAQNPENRWANYVLPWVPIFRGAGLVSKGRAAITAARAAAANGGSSGIYKALAANGYKAIKPAEEYLLNLYNLGWKQGGKKAITDFVRVKGPMIPEGMAIQGTFSGSRNLPGMLGYWRPEGTENMSNFQYAMNGMPIYTQFKNGNPGPLGLYGAWRTLEETPWFSTPYYAKLIKKSPYLAGGSASMMDEWMGTRNNRKQTTVNDGKDTK